MKNDMFRKMRNEYLKNKILSETDFNGLNELGKGIPENVEREHNRTRNPIGSMAVASSQVLAT